MGKRILVTGGAGFVGSNIAVSFVREKPGHRVIALDNLKRRGSELNLKRLRSSGVEFVHGDIRNPEDLSIPGFRPDLIIECSAEPSVLAGFGTSPRYVLNTNLVGTLNCLEAARAHNSSVIFLSTSRVYPIKRLNSLSYHEKDTRYELAETQEVPGASAGGIDTAFPLGGARSLYGATKLASELVLEEYAAMYGIKAVINRCGVIAGPWQMGRVDQGVFVHWVGSHYFKRDLSYIGYNGTGKQVRDLLHVDDLFRLVNWQANNIERVNRRVFNVGGGRPVSLSLLEATGACAEMTGNKLKVKKVDKEREADVRVYISDLTEVTRATGWAPEKGPDDILSDIFRWINTNEADVKRVLFT